MKALIKDKELQLKNIKKPTLKNDEVLIKVAMAGICRTDQYVGDGTIKIHKPTIIGHEFCGFIEDDPSDTFKKGSLVTVNPLLPDYTFIGIDHHGCFSEYIAIPKSQVFEIPTSNLKLAAYIEPIAASLAPLKSNLSGIIHIYGTNRIAKLTALILELEGFSTILIEPNTLPSNSCETIIETIMSEESMEEIQKLLKPNGKLILKSRFPNKIFINLYEFVKKDISIDSVYYYDFQKSINFALKHESLFTDFFGNDYSLECFEQAFIENFKATKKIFFKVD